MSKTMKVVMSVVAAMFLIIVFTVSWFVSQYNRLDTDMEQVPRAWFQLESEYQKRIELIPNILDRFKGSAEFEIETIQSLIDAHDRVNDNLLGDNWENNPKTFYNYNAAQSGLSSKISQFLSSLEKHPEIKTDKRLLKLENMLKEIEEQISVKRDNFNQAVFKLTLTLTSLPTNILGPMSGYHMKPYMNKISEGSDSAVRVEFE